MYPPRTRRNAGFGFQWICKLCYFRIVALFAIYDFRATGGVAGLEFVGARLARGMGWMRGGSVLEHPIFGLPSRAHAFPRPKLVWVLQSEARLGAAIEAAARDGNGHFAIKR